jgi:acyl-CoA synthetase (AMP-forming)/AMP-acid ligase II
MHDGIQTPGSALAAQFDGERRGATALEHRGRSIGHAELATASQSIANELERLGVKNGGHIGVLADDGSLTVPAMIGVLARGCVFPSWILLILRLGESRRE